MELPRVCQKELEDVHDILIQEARDEKRLMVEEEDFPQGSLFTGLGGDWNWTTADGWSGSRTFIGITGFKYTLRAPWGAIWEKLVGAYNWRRAFN